jgi:gluconolactonase
MKFDIYEPEVIKLFDLSEELYCIADGFQFSEGPVWDLANGCLYFSDIPGNTIYCYSESLGVMPFRKPSHFANGLTLDQKGSLVSCEHQTRRITREKGGMIQVLADCYRGKRLNSPNDVIVVSDGSIIFTDPCYGLQDGFGGPAQQELDFQGVYRIPLSGGEPVLLVDDFDAPNGLALSLNETKLYVDDTKLGHIRVFQVDCNWKLSGGEVLVELHGNEDGVPDGLKIDSEGNIFCTGPGGIWICSPAGVVLGRIKIDEIVANLGWGNNDQDTLYITASDKLYRLHSLTKGPQTSKSL